MSASEIRPGETGFIRPGETGFIRPGETFIGS